MKIDPIRTRTIAVLAADGFAGSSAMAVLKALADAGARPQVVSLRAAPIAGDGGAKLEVEKTFLTAESVMFDAVFVPGGAASAKALNGCGEAVHFLNEAFKHCKPIGALGEGVDVLTHTNIDGITFARDAGQGVLHDAGVVTARDSAAAPTFAAAFLECLATGRFWDREEMKPVPA